MKERPSKMEVCIKHYPEVKSYERIKFSTLYRRTFWCDKVAAYKYTGQAHDYTFDEPVKWRM